MRLKVIVGSCPTDGEITKDGVTIKCDMTEYMSQGVWALTYDNSTTPITCDIEFNDGRHNEELYASTVEYFLNVFDQKNTLILQDEHRRRKLMAEDYLTDWSIARMKRDELLSLTDWITLPDVNMDADLKSSWLSWRSQLRDITSSAATPGEISWPVPPSNLGKVNERYNTLLENYSNRKAFLENWTETPSVSGLEAYETSGTWF